MLFKKFYAKVPEKHLQYSSACQETEELYNNINSFTQTCLDQAQLGSYLSLAETRTPGLLTSQLFPVTLPLESPKKKHSLFYKKT